MLSFTPIVLVAGLLAAGPAAPASPSATERATAAALRGVRALGFGVSHPFTKAEAKLRVRQLLEYWSERFSVRNAWDGDTVFISGRVMGIDIHGWLEVGDHAVGGGATDPGFMLRDRAHDYVERKLKKYLHPTYRDT